MRCWEALPEEANIRNTECVHRLWCTWHVPVSRDFDLGRMRPEELDVRIRVVKKEGDDEAPGFPSALQLVQLALETTMFVRRQAV
jgi:hypothetical protein